MNDKYREEIVKENLQVARKSYVSTRPGFNAGQFYADKFNLCWISFDAYICSEFPNRFIGTRMADFIEQFEEWYESNYPNGFSSRFRESIEIISKLTVEDMNPDTNKPPISINEKNKLKDVLNVVYRIRCNLEHCGKKMSEYKNLVLVENSFYILYELLEKICAKENIVF